MDAKTLSDLFASELVVRHKGHEYRLRAPTIRAAAPVLAQWGKDIDEMDEEEEAQVPYLAALARAVEVTLVVEGELPEGIGARIVLGTGGPLSPVGRAAAKLCGLVTVGGEAPDDLPT